MRRVYWMLDYIRRTITPNQFFPPKRRNSFFDSCLVSRVRVVCRGPAGGVWSGLCCLLQVLLISLCTPPSLSRSYPTHTRPPIYTFLSTTIPFARMSEQKSELEPGEAEVNGETGEPATCVERYYVCWPVGFEHISPLHRSLEPPPTRPNHVELR